jgi:hypothetical protein
LLIGGVDSVNGVGGVALRILRFLLPPSPPPLNWQKEHYPVVVGSDIVGSGVRRSSQVVVELVILVMLWKSDRLQKVVFFFRRCIST